MKPFLTIRGAQICDAPNLSILVKRNIYQYHVAHYSEMELGIWERGYSVCAFQEQISSREVFVLEVNKMVCGTIQLDLQKIKGLYVDPRQMGKGYGKILLEFTLGHLRSNGLKYVELESNKWVVPFYEKFHFRNTKKIIVTWEGHPFVEYKMVREF